MTELTDQVPYSMLRFAGEIGPQAFRQALGRFLAGVTVVTARDPSTGQVRGMTASAFSSVSLDPPLAVVSLDRRSRMLETMRRASRFGVSILAEGQAQVARHFAGSPDAEAAVPEICLRSGVPVLADSLAYLVMSKTELHDAGDHVLLIGRIEELGYHEYGTPLAYFRGYFYRIAPTEADVLLAWRSAGEALWM